MLGVVARIARRVSDHGDRQVGLRVSREKLDRRVAGIPDPEERHVGLAGSRDPEDLVDPRHAVVLGVDLLHAVEPDLHLLVELPVPEVPVVEHPAPGEELGDVAVRDHDVLLDEPSGAGIFAKAEEQVQPPGRARSLLEHRPVLLAGGRRS